MALIIKNHFFYVPERAPNGIVYISDHFLTKLSVNESIYWATYHVLNNILSTGVSM